MIEDSGDEFIFPCDVRKFDGWKLICSLAIIWQNCENGRMKVRKLIIMFLNTEAFSGRNLRNKIYIRGLNLDLELL